jgi:hypothetical protein
MGGKRHTFRHASFPVAPRTQSGGVGDVAVPPSRVVGPVGLPRRSTSSRQENLSCPHRSTRRRSTRSASIQSARCPWTPCKRPTAATPAPRWGSPPSRTALFTKHMRHNPADPAWPNRDRFVLSNGHASMLLYAVLHLSGYDLPLERAEELPAVGGARRRAIPSTGTPRGSRQRPGRSGRGWRWRWGWPRPKRTSPRPSTATDTTIVDHFTYFIAGDGCLMEGISHEAASFAGHFKLGKTDRLLRRQRDLDRRQDGDHLQRRCRQALRGLRLAGAPRR